MKHAYLIFGILISSFVGFAQKEEAIKQFKADRLISISPDCEAVFYQSVKFKTKTGNIPEPKAFPTRTINVGIDVMVLKNKRCKNLAIQFGYMPTSFNIPAFFKPSAIDQWLSGTNGEIRWTEHEHQFAALKMAWGVYGQKRNIQYGSMFSLSSRWYSGDYTNGAGISMRLYTSETSDSTKQIFSYLIKADRIAWSALCGPSLFIRQNMNNNFFWHLGLTTYLQLRSPFRGTYTFLEDSDAETAGTVSIRENNLSISFKIGYLFRKQP